MCPCAVSMTMTSAPTLPSSRARSMKSPVAPTAAPTRRRPRRVFGGEGIGDHLHDVFDGDQSLQLVLLVDDEQFLDPVGVQFLLGLLDGDPSLTVTSLSSLVIRSAAVLSRSVRKRRSRLVRIPCSLPFLFGDRDSRNPVMAHDVQDFANAGIRPDGHGIDDHAGFRPFHFVDFGGLGGNRQVSVDDSDSSQPGQRNRQPCFSDRVHCRRRERDVQRDVLGEDSMKISFAGQNLASCGHQEDVIKRQSTGISICGL